MSNLYTLYSNEQIIFLAAPFGDEDEATLLMLYLFTSQEAAAEKLSELAEDVEDAILRELTLEEVLTDLIVDVMYAVQTAYVLVDNEEVFPLTQIGFEALQEYLPDDFFPFVDLEDSIHQLYWCLCERAKLPEKEIESLLESVAVQDALHSIRELEDGVLEPLSERPVPGSRFRVCLTQSSTGDYTVHNEDFTFTANITSSTKKQEIAEAMQGKKRAYFWINIDGDMGMDLELDRPIQNLDW